MTALANFPIRCRSFRALQITSASDKDPFYLCNLCSKKKTTDIRDLTDVNHERKRDTCIAVEP